MTQATSTLDRGTGGSEIDVSPEPQESPVEGIPVETMYDMLRNKRRRLVLHYLLNAHNHEAVLGSVATQIAAWENEIPVSAVTSTLRKRTYNTLQQNHLPKMDEAGLIEYERDRGTIVLASDPRQLELFLRALPKVNSSWTIGFLAAGFVLWLMLVANWIAVHILELYRPGQVWILTGFALLLVGGGLVHVVRIFR
mgnify:CR=1 FL=1